MNGTVGAGFYFGGLERGCISEIRYVPHAHLQQDRGFWLVGLGGVSFPFIRYIVVSKFQLFVPNSICLRIQITVDDSGKVG